jgi:hypothetical protein
MYTVVSVSAGLCCCSCRVVDLLHPLPVALFTLSSSSEYDDTDSADGVVL